MKQTVFVSPMVVVFADGSYEKAGFNWPSPVEQDPTNRLDIGDAREAVSLGLPIEIPEPIWAPKPGVAITSQEEIEARLAQAKASLRWTPSRVTGKVVLEWKSLHDYGCMCSVCPGETVYGEQDHLASGWEPETGIIPDAWFTEGSRDRIEVQTPDGRYVYTGRVAGTGGSGSLLWPEEAGRYGVIDPAVLAILQDGKRRWEISRAAIWQARDAKRREELSRKFNITTPSVVVVG